MTQARAERPRLPTPSFRGFTPASEWSSRAKRANRGRDTKPELILRRALDAYDLDYRTHEVTLPGRPDFVFSAAHLAVFCDGDFWRGRDWPQLRRQLTRRANAAYWVAKIAANRARDVRCQRALRKAGWTVLRVWETDVRRSPEKVARQIATRLAFIQRQAAMVTAPRTGHPAVGHQLLQGSLPR